MTPRGRRKLRSDCRDVFSSEKELRKSSTTLDECRLPDDGPRDVFFHQGKQLAARRRGETEAIHHPVVNDRNGFGEAPKASCALTSDSALSSKSAMKRHCASPRTTLAAGIADFLNLKPNAAHRVGGARPMKTHVAKRVLREARVRPAFAKQTSEQPARPAPRAFQAFARSLDLRISCTVT
jgi:hypothetical protein